MNVLSDWIKANLGLGGEFQLKMAATIFVLLFLWLGRRLVLYVVSKRVEGHLSLYRWRKSTGYAASLIAVLLAGRIWFEGLSSLSTFLGLLSAGLAIALRDALSNIAGWAYILWWKPFEVEDRIEVGEHRGDVIDIQTNQFSLIECGQWIHADQSTGRVLHIPNGVVFTKAIANYTKGFPFIWDELEVLITFESDWQKAKGLLTEIVNKQSEDTTEQARLKMKRAAKRYMIYYRTLTPIVYTSVKDSGVLLTLRYLTSHKSRRGMSQSLWEEILVLVENNDDIDLAYPTQRLIRNL